MQETVIFQDYIYYIDFFLKCISSLFLGGLIGYERAVKKKPAGIRTHSLICVGSAILTFLSFNFSVYADPARIAAQIVSGIGFIGAGTIFVSRQRVQGLTSAATVWVCAAIGMLVGANMTILAFLAVLTILGMLKIIKPPFSSDVKLHTMSIKLNSPETIMTIESLIKKLNISVYYQSLKRDDDFIFKLHYRTTPIVNYFFFKKLCQLKGVNRVYRI